MSVHVRFSFGRTVGNSLASLVGSDEVKEFDLNKINTPIFLVQGKIKIVYQDAKQLENYAIELTNKNPDTSIITYWSDDTGLEDICHIFKNGERVEELLVCRDTEIEPSSKEAEVNNILWKKYDEVKEEKININQ